jgi:hypothetical protein
MASLRGRVEPRLIGLNDLGQRTLLRVALAVNALVSRRARAVRVGVWVAAVGGFVGLAVRLVFFEQVRLQCCTACLRASPDRCAQSATELYIIRRSDYDPQTDARRALCRNEDYACLQRPLEDFAFTCESKDVVIARDWGSPVRGLTH